MIVIPKLSELYSSIITDLEAEYGESIPTFGKNFIRALAAVQSAKLNIQYRLIALTQKNIWVDTADSESTGGTLERFGRTKLGRDPFPAQAGEYEVTVTGNIGGTIPASTTFKSDDDSVNPSKLFVLDVSYVLVSVSDTITLRALESGLDSKLLVGDTLSATAPIANVDSVATVSLEAIASLSEETIEDYRGKVEASYRLESQGGSSADYVLWSFDIQGVQGVYPFAKTSAANEVNVFIEATIADSTDGKGTPPLSMLNDVESVIEFDPDTTLTQYERGRRPLGVFAVNVLPIAVNEIDINIDGFVGLDVGTQTSIFNALNDVIDGIRPFIAGSDILSKKNDILDVNKIISTILSVKAGSVFGLVTLKVSGVLTPSNTFINGDIPNLNTVTYI